MGLVFIWDWEECPCLDTACWIVVVKGEFSVDEDVLDSLCPGVGVGEIEVACIGIWLEENHVREIAWDQCTTFFDVEDFGSEGCHSSDHFFVWRELPCDLEESRECSKGPWVRSSCGIVESDAGSIGSRNDPRCCEEAPHVVL